MLAYIHVSTSSNVVSVFEIHVPWCLETWEVHASKPNNSSPNLPQSGIAEGPDCSNPIGSLHHLNAPIKNLPPPGTNKDLIRTSQSGHCIIWTNQSQTRIMKEEDIEIAIKVVIVGNGAVGKSSMIQRYCKGIFTKDYKKTIGVDFLERQVEWVN